MVYSTKIMWSLQAETWNTRYCLGFVLVFLYRRRLQDSQWKQKEENVREPNNSKNAYIGHSKNESSVGWRKETSMALYWKFSAAGMLQG